MDRRNMLLGATATGLTALTGCQTAKTIESGETLRSEIPSQDSSVAFGRIRWIENGEEKPIEQSLFGWWIAPRLRRVEDRAIINAEIDAGGHFAWSLPEGTYIMDRINYRDPMTGNYFFVPKVGFKIPQNGRTYYLGTLRGDAATDRGFFGVSGIARFTVLNELARERSYISQKLGVNIKDIETRLMVQDDRLPNTFDSTPEWNAGITILGALL